MGKIVFFPPDDDDDDDDGGNHSGTKMSINARGRNSL